MICQGRRSLETQAAWMDVIYRTMKRKASTSHDEAEATIRKLRKSPEFAAEYLRAALEDADEPRVLLVALASHRGSARRDCQGSQSGCPTSRRFCEKWEFQCGSSDALLSDS